MSLAVMNVSTQNIFIKDLRCQRDERWCTRRRVCTNQKGIAPDDYFCNSLIQISRLYSIWKRKILYWSPGILGQCSTLNILIFQRKLYFSHRPESHKVLVEILQSYLYDCYRVVPYTQIYRRRWTLVISYQRSLGWYYLAYLFVPIWCMA